MDEAFCRNRIWQWQKLNSFLILWIIMAHRKTQNDREFWNGLYDQDCVFPIQPVGSVLTFLMITYRCRCRFHEKNGLMNFYFNPKINNLANKRDKKKPAYTSDFYFIKRNYLKQICLSSVRIFSKKLSQRDIFRKSEDSPKESKEKSKLLSCIPKKNKVKKFWYIGFSSLKTFSSDVFTKGDRNRRCGLFC